MKTEGQMKYDLYRHFNAQDELLYVGISISAMTRLSQHRSVSGWYDEVSYVKIEKFNTREEVMDAEVTAIKEESPKYNIIHNKDTKKLDNNKLTRAEDSRFYLLDNVVNTKTTYRVSELFDALNLPKKVIKACLENGRLGSIVTGTRYNAKYNKHSTQRIVTGWQLIDFLEYLQDTGCIDE